MKRVVLVALAALAVAGACRKREAPAPDVNAANRVAIRSVRLYYETPGMLLAPEQRNVALPESGAAAVPLVVRELMKGPSQQTLARVWPADVVVRGAYVVPPGTVVIDVGGTTITEGWGTGTHNELMAIYSVVHTMTANFPEVKQVRILVNGTPAETLAGHIALTRSFGPRPSLVDSRAR